MSKEERPWGYFTTLAESESYKVKEIIVFPKKRLSLQRHQHRQEHWYIVSGEALVTLDQEKISLTTKNSIDIPLKSIHRIENIGENNLLFIEIQTGSYFGEDDIERFEDDFGRV